MCKPAATAEGSEREKLEAALARMGGSDRYWQEHHEIVMAAARKHLETLPKTKMVEVWRVDYAHRGVPRSEVYESRGMALQRGRELQTNRDGSREYACIKITGPHQQEVPA